jgi:predicted GNAT family acetyltransferase
MTEPEITVADVPGAQRYEIRVDGELAGYAEYRGRTRNRAFTHTEIDPRFEGQGLGSKLISAALEDARATDHTVVPICPFVHAYLAKHPEYLDLLEPHIRTAFHL